MNIETFGVEHFNNFISPIKISVLSLKIQVLQSGIKQTSRIRNYNQVYNSFR